MNSRLLAALALVLGYMSIAAAQAPSLPIKPAGADFSVQHDDKYAPSPDDANYTHYDPRLKTQ